MLIFVWLMQFLPFNPSRIFSQLNSEHVILSSLLALTETWNDFTNALLDNPL